MFQNNRSTTDSTLWVSFQKKIMIIKKILTHIYTFYTFWAIILHGAYFLWVAPNTSIIAWFVLIMSQIMLFIYPNYIKKYGRNKPLIVSELILHYLPVILLPLEYDKNSIVLFCISIILYIWVHWYTKIQNIYSDIKKTQAIIRKS